MGNFFTNLVGGIGKATGLENIFRPDKWTLGTALSAGSMLAPGGNLMNLGGVQNLGTKNIGLTSLLAGGSMSGGNTYTPPEGSQNFATTDILSSLLSQQMQFANDMEGKRQNTTKEAFDLLNQDPMGGATRDRNALMRFADVQGRRDASYLRNRGYASGVSDAAIVNARNQATQQANQRFMEVTDPRIVADNKIRAISLLSGGFQNALSGQMALQNTANAQRMADLQYEMNRPPTLFESAVTTAGSILPMILDQQKQKSQKNQGASNLAPLIAQFGKNFK